ncbi:glycosyltransferase [Amnibacterium endophyticum]|uniref:D-inositol 3-phosphate glycosyltransferase n=1 Tax=Amnibacterium endophyticum TaxID=2109337 RepID=A0ABW4LD19_9MICO
MRKLATEKRSRGHRKHMQDQEGASMTGLIVHEWIERRGGSENVLEAIAAAYPDAPVLTPWSNAPERLTGHDVRQSILARTPVRRSKPLAALVLPLAWRTMVPTGTQYEWVIASSHLFSHHVRVPGRDGPAPKFVYVHSPARYIWNPDLDARGANLLARTASSVLKPLDRRRAQEARRIAANSAFVRDRIKSTWGRDSTVIHPPVDVDRVRRLAAAPEQLGDAERSALEQIPEVFLLGASRFVSYKQLDRAIEVGEAADLPVVLAGGGPEEIALRARAAEATVPVYFVLEPTDAMLASLYARAAALVFLAIEDFGIMPVEAMATGTPVLARRLGGTAETVIDGRTGIFIEDESATGIRASVNRLLTLDRAPVASHADRFSTAMFESRLKAWVQEGLTDGALS